MSLQSTQAADQAKAAVNQNARLLQEKLAEKQKLLSQLDQAKMAEQMNTAMSTLTETVGGDVPTLAEVRDKIETRYAKAKGMSEIQGMGVETKMLEVEQASVNFEAQARLSEIRSKLGIGDTAPSGRGRRRTSAEPGDRTGGRAHPGTRELNPGESTIGRRGQSVSSTRSSRCTTAPSPSNMSDERRPAIVRSAAASDPAQALGHHTAPGSQISTASSAANDAADLDHTGCEQRPTTRDERPRRRRRRSRPGPGRAARTRSRACVPAAGGPVATTAVPTPATPSTASRTTSGREPSAMTARTPDHEAILAAASFEAIPPLPRSVPAPPASASTW